MAIAHVFVLGGVSRLMENLAEKYHTALPCCTVRDDKLEALTGKIRRPTVCENKEAK